MSTQYTYVLAQQAFVDDNLGMDPAEVHGLLCGLLCAGMGHSDTGWMKVLSEMANEGNSFSSKIEHVITQIFNQTCQELIEGQFSLNLMIPDDDTPINKRGLALIEWVQGFLAGFGMQQNDLTRCSEDVKEAMQDFTDIARMEEPMDEDEESERAFEEVVEYVRVSAIFCFGELGKSLLDDAPTSPRVH